MTTRGGLRPLAAVYAFFALAAGARGVVQTALAPGTTPGAHTLTLIAAALYVVGAVALHHDTVRSRRVLVAAMSIELVGVLVVGTATLSAPDANGAATVWSRYGMAYGWLPLVLPIAGLVTLAVRSRAHDRERAARGRRAVTRRSPS